MERFKGGLTRRNFIKAAGMTAAFWSLAGKIPQIAEAKTPATTANITDEFIDIARQTGGLSRWGYRLSNAYNIDDSLHTVYQRAIFEKRPDGQITLRNILDEFSAAGLDKDLLSGTYGVVMPLRSPSTYNLHILPPKIVDEITKIRYKWLEPGEPTSPLEDFTHFRVVRLQSIALQEWPDGKLEGILIGDAYQRMGLIPEEALLPVPQTDTSIDPFGCGNGPVWEGIATYYSRAGCVGCGPNRIMANGEPLDDTRLTLAFMRLPLNTPVLVENTVSGRSAPAIVTDRGGFERHGLVADLSLGLRNAIGGSDLTAIRIRLATCL